MYNSRQQLNAYELERGAWSSLFAQLNGGVCENIEEEEHREKMIREAWARIARAKNLTDRTYPGNSYVLKERRACEGLVALLSDQPDGENIDEQEEFDKLLKIARRRVKDARQETNLRLR